MGKLDKLYEDKDTRGDIKCRKSYFVPFDMLRVVEGVNIRDLHEPQIERFKASYLAGEDVPPIIIEVADDGLLDIVDGHHRYYGLARALTEGCEAYRVKVEEFTGTPADKLVLMVQSSQGQALEPVERAGAYARGKGLGMTNADIARRMGRTEGDVGNHLLLWECGPQVHRYVKEGAVSATTVFELARKHGPEGVLAILQKADTDDGEEGETESAIAKPKKKKLNVSPFSKKDGQTLAELIAAGDWDEETDEGVFVFLPHDAVAKVRKLLEKAEVV